MEVSWIGGVTPERMVEQLTHNYITAIHQGLLAIAKKRAPEITEWMKANRPWTDRTNQARTTLHVDVEPVSDELVNLLLAHGVEHGWYLEGLTPQGMETTQGGKYSILLPALDYWGPILMDDIRKMLG